MLTHNRPFDDGQNDFDRLWRFLREEYGRRQDHFVWLFSRLGDWKYGLWNEVKNSPTFLQDHAQLWLDEAGQLSGFVLSENGDNVFFIFTRHGCDALTAEILEWTLQHWGPRYGTLSSEVHEHQDALLAQLERRGFHNRGAVATTRAYDLRARTDEPICLPPGFRIVDMCENTDYRGKGLLYVNGFEGKDRIEEAELARFAHSRQSPAYDPRFDLSVITGDGQHVATCVGFNDPDYGVAEVEKVCTHNGYRRLGLAEAVIRACFQRLKQRGIQRAYISGYSPAANSLYEKLGPCARMQWFQYEWTP